MPGLPPRLEVVEIGRLPAGLLDKTAARVARQLGLVNCRAPSRLDPSFAYDEQRGQFHAGRLIERLRHAGDEDSRVVGAAAVDLFNPVLTFVFGEAEMPGRVAVFSIHRLREEFYGLPPDPGLLAARVAKEMLHELGHTYGLAHCADPACVMSSSHSVERVDLKGDRLCAKCSVTVSRARAVSRQSSAPRNRLVFVERASVKAPR